MATNINTTRFYKLGWYENDNLTGRIYSKKTNTAETELGRAQPQLVHLHFPHD